ncbi:MAG: hypothetical protein CUN55_13435 [Phototrophicales bacterium]|nr:MAG: hypothetical protein CUN55_13435 [Phototrophicales bacterium]
MTQTTEERIAAIRAKRRDKAYDHLAQYAPIWLVDEKVLLDEDAILFNVVFYHPRYGWVNRRYRYDAFADVLYQRGQHLVDEDEALEIQQQEPFIVAPTVNTVEAYGG